jgi:hypothetical protein
MVRLQLFSAYFFDLKLTKSIQMSNISILAVFKDWSGMLHKNILINIMIQVSKLYNKVMAY